MNTTLLEQLYMPSNDETIVALGGSALTLMEQISPSEQAPMNASLGKTGTNTGSMWETGTNKIDGNLDTD